jgi:pimeloyl-ACP methyl ester carboxylesterase
VKGAIYGRAVRVVLLHALPFDRGMWRAVPDLAGVETLAPSLYQFGRTLQDWAHGVLALVGEDPLVVVGCSIGGSCALEVARAAPDQVVGIVLVGAKAGVRPDPALRDDAVRLLTRQGMEAAWQAYWRPLFGRNTPAGVLADAHRMALEQDETDVACGVRAFHDRRDLTDFAVGWPKPLVVISGDQDRTPAPTAAARITAGPDRHFHLIENCGHYVSLERPAELRSIVESTISRLR